MEQDYRKFSEVNIFDGKERRWALSSLSPTLHRHWNIKTHIKRKHGAIGQPIKAGSSTFNNNINSSQFVSDTIDYVKKDN